MAVGVTFSALQLGMIDCFGGRSLTFFWAVFADLIKLSSGGQLIAADLCRRDSKTIF